MMQASLADATGRRQASGAPLQANRKVGFFVSAPGSDSTS